MSSAWVSGYRWRVSRVRNGGLWLLKNTLNRVTSTVARSGHGPFSLVEHVGRKSGKTYQTPIIVARVPDGFIAELTYGENVNWYRNIEAAGSCVLIVAALGITLLRSSVVHPKSAGPHSASRPDRSCPCSTEASFVYSEQPRRRLTSTEHRFWHGDAVTQGRPEAR